MTLPYLILLACGPAAIPVLPDDTAPPADTEPTDTTPTDTPPTDTAPVDTALIDTGPVDSGPAPDSGPCELSAEAEAVNLWEGDTVQIIARCAHPDAGDWTVTPVSFDGEVFDEDLSDVLWDGETWAWRPGVADGGRHTISFTAQPAGGDRFPETAAATVWIADNPADPDNVRPDPATYTEEWGLPVVHVETLGDLSQSYVDANIHFGGVSYFAEIKIRGASSTNYPKNSYTLDFREENLDTMGWLPDKKDHLVLTTPFDDNSYVRQKLAYDVWVAMAEFWKVERLTPRTFFAVLYFDGVYHGLYTAADHVDEEFVGEMGFSREGNLYKSVNHDADFRRKSNLHAGYEEKEGEPLSDYSDLDSLVWFTGQPDTTAFLAEADEWLQVDEFMDWFLFVHYTASEDSGGKNAYLYNDPAAPNAPEFRYAPWDFNHSFGQTWQTVRLNANSNNDFTSVNNVFEHLQSDPASSAELWARLNTMMDSGGPLSPDWFTATLDDYYALIDDSAARDWAAWGGEYESYWYGVRDRCGDCLDYEGEKAYVYDWLSERDSWMRTFHP